MDDAIDATRREYLGGGSTYDDVVTEAQVEARLRMESMSRVACALIFQSARDLVCAQRTASRPQTRRPKAVREARQWIQEISIWARTLHPLRYEGGGITLAGAVETINVHQDFRGGRRVDYWAVRECLLREPHRLAVVDGPAEFRTLTCDPSDTAVCEMPNPDSSVDLIRVISEYEKVTSLAGQRIATASEDGEENDDTLTMGYS
jgi:hypothetical protein